MPKTKQQEAQEKRLQRNIRQAKKARADAKTSGNKTVRTRPPKKGGFFAGLKTDAPQTVQQSIPYKEMYRDGICRLTDKLYTKTVQFFDINYQLAQADDKAQIFEGYCDFLNYFDASIHVQLTFINQRANMQDFARSIDIPVRGDEYDGIRREYGDMLKGQLQKGNNGLTKRKYITFGIEADDLRTAKMRLERIEADVLANFKALGAQAKPLNGLERLDLLHSQLHPDGQEKFHFTWADLLASREIENIFENSDFIYMLNQAQGDRQILAKQLGISPHQLSYVTHSGPGEGLLFFGNVIIPFVDHFPKDTLLYSVLTTRPDEVAGA